MAPKSADVTTHVAVAERPAIRYWPLADDATDEYAPAGALRAVHVAPASPDVQTRPFSHEPPVQPPSNVMKRVPSLEDATSPHRRSASEARDAQLAPEF